MTAIQQLLSAVDSKAIDILQVKGLLSEISRVEAEISLRTEVVLSGRLNEENQKRQYQQQQQFLTVPMGRSGSSKDRRRKKSKETCGRNCSSPMQQSRSLREKLGFN